MIRPASPRVVVVGAFYLDLAFWVMRRPERGETLMGERFGMFAGGKGFNQAVAAARLGAQVTMIGRLGTDSFSQPFLEALESEGIQSSYVCRDPHSGTGVSSPLVEPDGSNSIVYAPPANARLALSDVEGAGPGPRAADVLLLQLKTPTSASARAAQIAREAGAIVVLNPAPARCIPDAPWSLCDILVPNEIEAAMRSGCPVEDPLGSARTLLARGPQAIVVTLGEQGALLATSRFDERFAAHKVKVVDSVAAGDAFCGALAVCLAKRLPLPESVRYANAAGALAVTAAVASPSMPRSGEVDALLSAETAQSR